jgi:DNA-binding GntR family transcriptional regulator
MIDVNTVPDIQYEYPETAHERGTALRAKNRRETEDPEEKGKSLTVLAYSRILEMLFERRVAAGSLVSQGELAALIDIPIGPLRDALRVLEAEGLLTIHPRVGVEFVKPGLELLRSTYQLRGIIEAAAVAVYAETADARDMEEMERRHRDAISALERDGLTPEVREGLDELDAQLHKAIIAGLQNPLVENIYRRVHNYLRILRLDRKQTEPLAMRFLQEHMAIIAACRRRKAAEAQAALQVHFSNALQRNMGLY